RWALCWSRDSSARSHLGRSKETAGIRTRQGRLKDHCRPAMWSRWPRRRLQHWNYCRQCKEPFFHPGGCNQSGDGCWAVANRCGISQADLEKYNRANLCNTLVKDENVCCSSGTLPRTLPPGNTDGTCKT